MSNKPDRSGLKFDFEITDKLPEYMGTVPMSGSKFAEPLRVATDHLGLRDGARYSAWARFLFETTEERTQFQSAVSAHAKALKSKDRGWKFQTRTDKKDPCIVYVRKIAV